MDDEPHDDDLTSEEVRRVIEDERRLSAMPRFETAPPRRHRRQNRRRSRPPLAMQEFLDFLDKSP
jgi:hypothetical protein